MPQNEYIEGTRSRGTQADLVRGCQTSWSSSGLPRAKVRPPPNVPSNTRRKKEAREVHKASKVSQSLIGLKAKLHNRKRHLAKIQMKKQLKQHEQRNIKQTAPEGPPEGAVPTYLLDRAQERNAKELSSMVKQKRKEAAARFSVPLPKVRGVSEEEVFKVLKTGKSKGKSWKRVITKPTFVGEGFTRRPVKVCSSGAALM
jgi:ribosome biogenesis protein NSA2